MISQGETRTVVVCLKEKVLLLLVPRSTPYLFGYHRRVFKLLN